ncbi:MAG: arginine decarboxylase [Flavobacteriales bacterium]
MQSTYHEILKETLEENNSEFEVIDNELHFHKIPLMDIIKQYGTPLRITYLPNISKQIQRAKTFFKVAIARQNYTGNYTYCYCTKSSHFSFVMEEALKNDIHIETSSAFDLHIIKNLYQRKKLTKETFIISNGFKRPAYTQGIVKLINEGFNIIPVLDNMNEFKAYEKIKKDFNIGIRIATEEQPNFDFYTSRLGINPNKIVDFYKEKIKSNRYASLKMLHFFINTGVQDNDYYWNELSKCLQIYIELKKICPELDSLNIGGGFPIKSSLQFEWDYDYIAEKIVETIKNACDDEDIKHPNLFTEFGTFTVGESGLMLYTVLNQKQQNDREMWYMINNSFMTTLPDVWAIDQRYPMLAINNWDKESQRVFLGGLTCDSEDFYNAEKHNNKIFLPKLQGKEPLHLAFFYTGAYQESLSGVGGLKHCLIPSPKHIIISKEDDDEDYTTKLFSKEQSPKSMMKILGY